MPSLHYVSAVNIFTTDKEQKEMDFKSISLLKNKISDCTYLKDLRFNILYISK